MYVRENSKEAWAHLPGIDHQTLAGSGDGLGHLSVWRNTIAPGGATPPHRHDCEEVVVVQSGRGTLFVEGRGQEFGPDTTLLIPAHVDHQIVNTGDQPLTLIAAFSATPVKVTLPGGEPFELPWRT
jgi:mannose-6-phosphate isomerase-like protein (cupin superfamily)